MQKGFLFKEILCTTSYNLINRKPNFKLSADNLCYSCYDFEETNFTRDMEGSLK